MAYELTNAAQLADVREGLGITPRNRLVAQYGDSITSRGTTATATTARGLLMQAQAMSLCRFEASHALNFGVSGDTTTMALARIGTVLAAKPGRVFTLIGTNDITGAVPKQTIWDNIRTMADAFEAAGIPFDISTLLPRSYSMNTAYRNALYWINEKISREEEVRRSPYYNVIDCFSAMVDRSASTLSDIPASTDDGLHPIGYGAQLCASPISAFYDRVYGPPAARLMTRDSVYSATDNPFGSLFVNPVCFGTGGTVAASAAGVVMDNMTLERSTGSTLLLTGSKGAEPAPSGGASQIVTLSGSGGAASEFGRLVTTSNMALTNVPVGTRLVVEFDVEQSGLQNVINIKATTNDTGGGSATGLSGSGITGDRERATLGRRIIRTAPMTTTSSATAVNASLSINADCTGTVAGTITVRGVRVRAA